MFEIMTGAELAAALESATPETPASVDAPDSDDSTDAAGESLEHLVDRVTACDRLIGWATSQQARAVAALGAGYEQQYSAGLPPGASWLRRSEAATDAAKDCAVELGLARITGINAANNLARFADELVVDHPRLLQLMETGRIPVWNIHAALNETRPLASSLRKQADSELAEQLPGMSWSEASQAAARVVIELDPDAANKRAQAARSKRTVTIKPGRDGMAGLWANLPTEHTLACWQALDDQARGLKADGDTRTLQHLMCDTLVARVAGISRADHLPVRIDVVVCASTLTGADHHPAQLRGYGPIPTNTLRDLLGSDDVVLRRLITDPIDDHALCIDSRQRFFRGQLRDLIRTRDPVCVLPGCDRPATQVDHVIRWADGGTTSPGNGLGVCTRHNLAREHPAHQLNIRSRNGDRDGDDGGDLGDRDPPEIWWRTLSRKVYRLRHPPALGPGATRKPRPPRRQ